MNRDYAGSIATEIQPLVEEGFDAERIKSAIHYMMVLNPMMEIYILDDRGTRFYFNLSASPPDNY